MEEKKEMKEMEQGEEEKKNKIKNLTKNKKNLALIGGALLFGAAVFIYNNFISGGQSSTSKESQSVWQYNQQQTKQTQKVQHRQAVKKKPVRLVRPVVKKEKREEKKEPVIDPFTARDREILSLEKEKELLKLRAEIIKLKTEIAEKEKKLKSLKPQVKESEVERLKREIELLKMQISSMKERKKEVFVRKGIIPEVRYTVQGVSCSGGKCKAVITDGTATYAVTSGSRLLDGTVIKSITINGVYMEKMGQVFYKPVEMFIPAQQEEKKRTKRRKKTPSRMIPVEDARRMFGG